MSDLNGAGPVTQKATGSVSPGGRPSGSPEQRAGALRSARYSIGYPACPDLADRAKIARLPSPERIGVTLSEEMQLHPEQSTDAIVIHHPEARYFSV
jgi:5-methyltetrahydrofolate--homocysteine methyltransferase